MSFQSPQEWETALARWLELQRIIKPLSEEEKALRQVLFDGSFPKPTEGVNTIDLPDGRKLKGTYKINRTVVEAMVMDIKVDLDTFNKVFKVKHDLVTAQYRQLDDKTRKQVDKALKIAPGLPALEIVEAKPNPTLIGSLDGGQ